MSVKGGILAILSLGPAYGHQVRAELISRAPHREAINVGQIYGTLDRLLASGLIAPAATTEDGLPRYRLSASGEDAARQWTTRAERAEQPEWSDMLDQLLVTASLPRASTAALFESYRLAWSSWARATPAGTGAAAEADTPEARSRVLAAAARGARAAGALAWLEGLRALGPDATLARPLSDARPRRGRPRAPVTSADSADIEAEDDRPAAAPLGAETPR